MVQFCDHITCTISSRIEVSARALVVLDVDGENDRFNVEYTHSLGQEKLGDEKALEIFSHRLTYPPVHCFARAACHP